MKTDPKFSHLVNELKASPRVQKATIGAEQASDVTVQVEKGGSGEGKRCL